MAIHVNFMPISYQCFGGEQLHLLDFSPGILPVSGGMWKANGTRVDSALILRALTVLAAVLLSESRYQNLKSRSLNLSRRRHQPSWIHHPWLHTKGGATLGKGGNKTDVLHTLQQTISEEEDQFVDAESVTSSMAEELGLDEAELSRLEAKPGFPAPRVENRGFFTVTDAFSNYIDFLGETGNEENETKPLQEEEKKGGLLSAMRSKTKPRRESVGNVRYGVVAVIGCQGSGKSTLLNELFGTNFPVLDIGTTGIQVFAMLLLVYI